MLNFQDVLNTGPSDDTVIRTQLESLVDIMVGQVQDRCCTDAKLLQNPPIGLGAYHTFTSKPLYNLNLLQVLD